MKSRLDLDQSLETPGAGAVSREERYSVATVSQELGEFWETWVGDSVLCCAALVTSCMESSLAVLALMSQVEQGLAGLDTAAVYTGAFT